ncbi:conserved exported hypothetical protein [Cupriavidus taiwanensis]|uniref:Lipoprotein n=2 Tax=Cupriavidus taiwanensis TaxID=164546 RepID=A0A976AZG6_9BURK|nr:conserved exported hypothetical protein [Cupriavidus taiwanensis]SOZ31668.1 conserved exported hypothetical protein [Cupriavidus taiwanensis]SOZ47566.1 conserved exported hypothetical protein [Cupriavidus taiwanensis]SOZ61704.1 conserved exported hypothetical protein [Cupriavidus taiwanensis]SOZ66013.1 conserved exported hypothetical protein [Cupriavidus taiwanensis]
MHSSAPRPTMWSIARRCAGIAAAWLLAGCAATPPAHTGCTPWQQQRARPALPVSFLSPELAAMVAVPEAGPAGTAGSPGTVHAGLHNCTEFDVALLVRTRFRAAQPAAATEPPSAWRTLVLPPRTQVDYAEHAVLAGSVPAALEILDAQRAQQPYRPGQHYPALPGPARP